MKLKKRMLVICLILFILIGISSVSAADNDTVVLSDIGDINDDILSIDNYNDKILGDTNDGSFADLNTKINGNSSTNITLDKNYTYSTSDTIKTGIVISKNNIVIDGKGHTIDAKNQARIFNVTGTTVTLKNINFINGFSQKTAGAVYNYGENLRILNCTFMDNTANSWGGAVYSYPNSYSIFANSTFINNKGSYGGAMALLGDGNHARHDVLNCTFIGNKATADDIGGGAIFYYADWDSNNYVRSSLFINNTAVNGGAIYNYINSMIDVSDSIFIQNSGYQIDSFAYHVDAKNCWFGNTVDNMSASPNVGKTINVSNWLYFDMIPDFGSLSVTVSINNLYDNATGKTSIYKTSKLPSIDVGVTAKNATFDKNIVTLDNSGKATVSYNVMSDYTLTAKYEKMEISKSFISGSFTELQDLIDNAPGDEITLEKDYTFTPSVDTHLTAGVTISRPIIINGNGYTVNGAGKSRVFYINHARGVTLENIIIANGNTYLANGAGVLCYGNNINFINCTFINNYADSDGGAALHITYGNGTNIIDCKFINNTEIEDGGGAIYLDVNGVEITNTLFEGNHARIGGGAIHLNSGGTKITNCTFKNNYAHQGGAIRDCDWSDLTTIVTDCIFIGNNATGDNQEDGGGAIRAHRMNIDNTIFIGNNAKFGAAIFIIGGNYVNVDKALFINNTARTNAIVFSEYGSNIENSIFVNNHIPFGYLISSVNGEGFRTNYNWFGNVWKNHNTNYVVSNLCEMDNWLFLNLTEIVYDDNKSTWQAKFNFFVYDKNNDNIIPYDFNNLPLFDLKLSSINLTLDKNVVSLGQTINATVDYYKGILIAEYENVKYEMPFKFKIDTWIEVNSTINVPISKKVSMHDLIHPFEYDYMYFLQNANRIRYVSSDTGIVKVDKWGKLNGVSLGVANVTIYFYGTDVMGNDQYNPSTAVVTVNVTRIPTSLKPVIVPNSTIELNPNAQTVRYSLDPYVSGSIINYTSNDTSIATIDYGMLKTLKYGVVNITVSYAGNEKYAPCSTSFILTVTKKQSSIRVSNTNLTLDAGQSPYYVGVSVNPSGVDLKVNSSNPDVATVSLNNGQYVITPISGGLTNITFTFEGNEKYEPSSNQILVKVIDYETYIDVNSTIEINVGDIDSLPNIFTLRDSDGNQLVLSPAAYNFKTNDSNILNISEYQSFTALNAGKALLTIEFLGYDKYKASKASVTVIVSSVKTEIKVEPEITIYVGDNVKLNETSNINVLSRIFSYASDNNNIVFANKFGYVLGISEGSAKVTIKFEGNDRYQPATAEVMVNVVKVPTTVEVGKVFTLLINETESLNATLNPSAAGSLLSYTSSNANVVKVDQNGKITAVGEGTAYITVKFSGNNKYAASNATVEVNVASGIVSSEIKVNDTIDLKAGDKVNIGAVLVPSNAGILNYSSNDTDVITVDENGVITAIAEGQAIITIQLTPKNNFEPASASVIVNVSPVVTSIDVTSPIEINLTETKPIDYIFSHPDAGDLVFTVGDESIIDLENGIITAKKVGTTTITITFKGNKQYTASSATINVAVVDVPVAIDAADSITINVTDIQSIDAKLNPKVGDLVYTSSDESIVTVNQNGVIKGIKTGEADITISFAGNGKYRANSVKVHVTVDVVKTEIKVENTDISLFIDDNVNLNATLSPSDAGELNYTSSDPTIVSIDENGQMTALKEGNVIITVSYTGEGKFVSSSKSVNVKVTKIATQINIDDMNMELGISVVVKPIVSPIDILIKNLTYISSDENIIEIHQNGYVYAAAAGKAIITIRYAGNDKYAPCERNMTITVSPRHTFIEVKNDIEIGYSDSMDLGAVVKASFDTPVDGELTYSSSNPEIVSVGKNGKITANKRGNAVITINYEGYTNQAGYLIYYPSNATVNVVVEAMTTEITLNSNKITLYVDDETSVNAKLNRPSDGKLDYSSSNPNIAKVDSNGKITAVGKGNAIITVAYAGNNDYRSSSAKLEVVVKKVSTTIKVNQSVHMYVDGNVNLNASVLKTDGRLTYSSSNPSVVTVDARGNLNAVRTGSSQITIKLEGDSKYAESLRIVIVYVYLVPTSIKVDPIVMYVGDEFTIKNGLTPTGIGKLTYDGYNWDIIDVDSNGLVKSYIEGTTEIIISYAGNYKYAPSNCTVPVTVKKFSIPSEECKFDILVRDEIGTATFSVKLPDYAEGTFYIIIDGNESNIYSEEIVNGVAKLTVEDLKPGQHNVSMGYSGNLLYSSVSEFDKFYLSKIKIDRNRDIPILYTATGKYIVHLTKDTQAMSGKVVTFYLNGKKLTAKTNKNGYAYINVKLPVRAKPYVVTAQFGNVKVANKISIKSIVVAKNVIVKKSASISKIQVSLKKVNGKFLYVKKVTLKFAGKTFISKTNKKGIAVFYLKKAVFSKLKVGKVYNYKVSFLKDSVARKIFIRR